ncbi:cobalt-precorrin 5A hydrolase [Shimwellia blattae]|uniref:Cobalamin biosynthesis protein CbiG n=2 Tax=Shimwellia blattae TaxID=563 RepID=I2B7T1_SHIBC|nr:cobalt-precorrin 5A hydrolase [Shimwellia blattae]AFJ46585.1 cobalamin biosynthesis protein CbiG [Shimwellia blattae DSM 4481 = NBRC 105725]GAB80165.1 cobalamin biosynthesis protein CbiG [Shimwellia blattae DSM 4481 = NBRC 105725]VDY64055.1 cobalamin biosynthesis protein CbiG [Shimwellia blattae]VEC22189.1 cobalamin biosynthesis protein CbiG [Shimwellia blattae]
MNTAKPEPLALFCLTPGGVALARRLQPHLALACFTSPALVAPGFHPFEGGLMAHVRRAFTQYPALIIIGATGVAVRAIAPVVQDKFRDPAVVVIDEQGQHVISLLSGHMGGANALTRQLAGLLGADPVITTATDVNQLAALDLLARQLNARSDHFRHHVKTINQGLVSGQRIGLWWDNATLGQPPELDLRGFIPVADIRNPGALDNLVCITLADTLPACGIPLVKLVPRRVVAGMGCRRHSDPGTVERLLRQQLAANHLDPLALGAISSIDLKRDEPALMALAQQFDVPFHTFSAETLRRYEHQVPGSAFVRQITGVGNVSQTAAWHLCQGDFIGEPLREQGVTIALGRLPGVENKC